MQEKEQKVIEDGKITKRSKMIEFDTLEQQGFENRAEIKVRNFNLNKLAEVTPINRKRNVTNLKIKTQRKQQGSIEKLATTKISEYSNHQNQFKDTKLNKKVMNNLNSTTPFPKNNSSSINANISTNFRALASKNRVGSAGRLGHHSPKIMNKSTKIDALNIGHSERADKEKTLMIGNYNRQLYAIKEQKDMKSIQNVVVKGNFQEGRVTRLIAKDQSLYSTQHKEYKKNNSGSDYTDDRNFKNLVKKEHQLRSTKPYEFDEGSESSKRVLQTVREIKKQMVVPENRFESRLRERPQNELIYMDGYRNNSMDYDSEQSYNYQRSEYDLLMDSDGFINLNDRSNNKSSINTLPQEEPIQIPPPKTNFKTAKSRFKIDRTTIFSKISAKKQQQFRKK